MRILAVTLLMREPDGRAKLYGRALQSVFNLRWQGAMETLQVVGADDYLHPAETVTRKYNVARDVFLRGDYSHMLTVEHDMIVPRDALEKLAALECDIAYGLYAMRHVPQKWSAFSYVDKWSGVSYSENADIARSIWGTTIDVAGIGMGCTLIKRHVIEAQAFTHWRGVDCDWELACRAQTQGYTQRCDLSVVCGHMSLLPSPCVFTPDTNAENLVRMETL